MERQQDINVSPTICGHD